MLGHLPGDHTSETVRVGLFATMSTLPAHPRGSNGTPTGCCASTPRESTDLSIHYPEDLEIVAQELNGRPRGTLGWETPLRIT
jgi:transposase, IS30 family